MQTDTSLGLQPLSEKSIRSIKVKVKKLSHFKGKLPEYKSQWASGFDIRACLEKPMTLKPGERGLVPTGLSFEIPLGFELQSRPRSGLALKKGLTVLNSPGTIDSDYRGEIKVILINHGLEDFIIKDQERISQLVLCPVYQSVFEESETLSETQRGGGGFGSTGV